MKVGDLITYEGRPSFRGHMPTGVVLKVYKHLQEFKQVKPFWRELVDVLWEHGDIVTHDTNEMEVISESR